MHTSTATLHREQRMWLRGCGSSHQPVSVLEGTRSVLSRQTETCQPHTHLMFLKTHKTASSTLINMLYRFGEERGLRFALPFSYMLGYPFTFNVHRIKGYHGNRADRYDIMANHLRFNKDEVCSPDMRPVLNQEKILHAVQNCSMYVI